MLPTPFAVVVSIGSVGVVSCEAQGTAMGLLLLLRAPYFLSCQEFLVWCLLVAWVGP